MKKTAKEELLPGIKTGFMAVGVFVGLLLSLYLMMVLFATIPNQSIKKNMLDSASYELSVEGYVPGENGSLQKAADHYADQIWLNIAWQMGRGAPFAAVLDTGYYDGGQFGTAVGLRRTITADMKPNVDYSRYWHGSAAVLRFTHIFTDVQGTKAITMVCLLALVAVTVYRLFRGGHGDLAMCLLAALLAVQPMQLRLCVEYLPCFLICFGFCPAFLKWEKRGDRPLALLAVAVGVMTSFFDFLTVETVTILVPLILVLGVRSMDRRITSKKDTALLLVRCLLFWGLAYVSAFAVKWIAVDLVTGEDRLSAAVTAAAERADGLVLIDGVRRAPGVLLGIGSNLSVLFGGTDRTGYGRVLIFLLLLGGLGYGILRRYPTRRRGSRGTGFILAMGILPLLRYAILPNHAYLHAFFTYRALMSTVFAVLTVLMLNLRPRRKKGRR